MTVLERNSAEDEVLKMAKFIRKPGDTIDLAQQLISLGVNTEILIRDLELFEKVGPELARTIQALKQHEAELLEIVEAKRAEGTRAKPWWRLLWLILSSLVLWLLASNGLLGPDMQAIVP